MSPHRGTQARGEPELEAREGTAAAAADQASSREALERAERRLSHLSEIGRLFASFGNALQTIDSALAVIGRTVPLRSAILIEAEDSSANWIVWLSEGTDPEQVAAVKRHAETAYRYLMGSEPGKSLPRTEHGGVSRLPRQPILEGELTHRLIIVPLVVARRPIFGAFQLEVALPPDKSDLMFVNAVANLLAIGLDRDRAWRLDIVRRERAEEERLAALERAAAAERESLIAEQLRQKYEALAAENAALYEQAQEAVRVREQILGIVSHDLRNPIHTILMSVALLAQKAAAEDPAAALPEPLARVQRAGQRMLRLIGDLLDFTSIQAGSLAVQPDLQDAGAILLETLASFESQAEAKKLRLTADHEPRLQPVFCDRDRLLQVLGNLVSNAISAAPEGGQVQLRVEDRDHEFHFSVADDGPGFSAEDARHLFDRYWRSDDSGYHGTGLGLAISRGIVSAHGGRIWAESVPGHGARFFFTIPTPDDRRHTTRRSGEPFTPGG